MARLTFVEGEAGNEEIEDDLGDRDVLHIALDRHDIKEPQEAQEEENLKSLHVPRHAQTAPRVAQAGNWSAGVPYTCIHRCVKLIRARLVTYCLL